MARAMIEVVGDARSYLASLKRSSQATRTFEGDLKKLATNTKATAEARVKASVQTDQRLRSEITMYKELAAAAKRGSREEVAASNLAAQAQKRLSTATATSTREQKQLAAAATRAGHSIRTAERETGKIGRGALAGAGAFRSMGRSLAFASAGFLGFAAVSEGIKAVVSGAASLQKEIGKVGVVFQGAKGQVLAWAKSLPPALGMTTVEALKAANTFGRMIAPLGIARKQAADMATELGHLAPDLAAFADIPVDKVILALRGGLAGMARPMRQFGVFLSTDRLAAEALSAGIVKSTADMSKVAPAQEKVSIATAKAAAARKKYGEGSVEAKSAELALENATKSLSAAFGGHVPKLNQAQKTLAAYNLILKDTRDLQGYAEKTGKSWAGEQRQLHAIIGNLEEAIGKLLLPTFLKWLTALTTWLSQSKNQRTIIDAIRGSIDALGKAFGAAWALIGPLFKAVQGVAIAVGGWKDALILAAGAWVGFKVAALTSTLAVTTANLVAAEVVSSAWKAALLATGWGALAVAAGAAAAYIMTHWKKVKVFFEELWIHLQRGAVAAALGIIEPFTHLGHILGGWAQSAKRSLEAELASLTGDLSGLGAAAGNAMGKSLTDSIGAWGPAAKAAAYAAFQQAASAFAPPVTARDRRAINSEAEAAAVRAGDAKQKAVNAAAAKAKVKADKAAQAAADKALKDAQAAYAKALADATAAGKGLTTGTPQSASDKASKEAAARLKRQYRFLGLTASGEAKLTVSWLRTQLGTLEKVVKGTFLDTEAQRSQMDKLRTLLSGKLGQLSDEMKAKIRELIDGAKQKLADFKTAVTSAANDLRGTMGELFQGPVLNPSEQQKQMALGVKFTPTDTGTLTKDVRAQTQQFTKFEQGLATLGKRGAPKELLKELRAQGMSAAPEVAALAGATGPKLAAFLAAFRAREKAIGKEAVMEVKASLVHLHTPKVNLDWTSHRTLGGAAGGEQPIVVYVNLDGKRIATATTRHQQRKGKRSTSQTRGRGGGTNVGLG